jgi:hypothetical protein
LDQDANEGLSREEWANGLTRGFLLVMFIVALTVWIDNQPLATSH